MKATLQLLGSEPRWLSAADLARFIRADLKAAFPGVKFSVRAKSYSMGSSVDVYYEKGPRPSVVEEVAHAYQGIGFDGTDDSTHYHPVTLPSGEVVRATSYIGVSRRSSDDFDAEVSAALAFVMASGNVDEFGQIRGERPEDFARRMVWTLDYRDADPVASSFARQLDRYGTDA